MNGLFNIDNPVWRFIGKIVDACFLSVVYLIFCIPIFTIGSATTALYYVCLKMVKDTEGYLVKDFVKAFYENFKQSTIIWLILLAFGLVLGIDLLYFKNVLTKTGFFMYYLILILFLFYFIMYTYIFALSAQFKNTTKNMFKIAFALSIKHLGWTILIVVVSIIIILISLFIPILFLIFIPGILTFFNSFIFSHIFAPYIKNIQENENKNKE